MSGFDWKTALPEGLQLLGTALTATGVGAGAGAIASGLGAVVAHVLGVPATHEAVTAAAANLSPEQQAALLTLQETNKAELQAASIAADVAKVQAVVAADTAALADTQDARKLEGMRITAGRSNIRANWMLAFAYLACVVIVVLMLGYHVDGNTAVGGALILLLGGFSKDITQAFTFEFGSSRSSQAKDATIAATAAAATAIERGPSP